MKPLTIFIQKKVQIKGALSSQRQFLAIESHLKMIKSLFVSPLKLFLLSGYLNCSLDVLVMQENGLIRKIKLISRPGKQTNAIHILANIARSKDNPEMKFGQLIEYNMRNIFLEESYTKCC